MEKRLCQKCHTNACGTDLGRKIQPDGSRITYYRKLCSNCSKGGSNAYLKKTRYSKLVDTSVCMKCGFVPEHRCQIDIDHIDGDHTNDSPANLQALCANCHRLKTQVAGEYRKKSLP